MGPEVKQMLEKGYSVIGSSSFEIHDWTKSWASEQADAEVQARAVGADLLLLVEHDLGQQVAGVLPVGDPRDDKTTVYYADFYKCKAVFLRKNPPAEAGENSGLK